MLETIKFMFSIGYRICSVDKTHHIYDNREKFCWECGAKTIEVSKNPYKKPRCLDCNKEINGFDYYCTNCGRKLR
jgi:hypothetical protein